MNLNGRVTNPGELRTWVGLGSRTITTQPGGFQTPVYAEFTSVWAKWVNQHGGEILRNQAGQVVRQATVTIRWRNDIDLTSGVEYQGAWWDVVSVDNIRERNEWLELRLQRVDAA